MELNSIKEIEDRLNYFLDSVNFENFILENPILFDINMDNFMKLKVCWKDCFEDIIDYGIMFLLPGYITDEYNFIVSFPKPYDENTNDLEPVYIHILDLVTNPLINSIENLGVE